VRARSMIKPVAMVAAGGLLVAVAVIGTRAMGGLELEFRPLLARSGGHVLEVVLLAAAVLCLPLMIVGMILRRRAEKADEGGNLEWLRRLVFIAVLVASVIVLRELLPSEAEQDAVTDADAGRTRNGPADVLWSAGTAVLAVVLAAAAVLVLWFRRHLVRERGRVASSADIDDDSVAVRAGRAVLDREWDDPREAVVSCYAAMEEVLAESGNARGRAETPEELLQRAISDGRLAPTPGHRLTELFLAARYSSATVTNADVAAAREALHSIEPGAVLWP
jgi:hypothetical protein